MSNIPARSTKGLRCQGAYLEIAGQREVLGLIPRKIGDKVTRGRARDEPGETLGKEDYIP